MAGDAPRDDRPVTAPTAPRGGGVESPSPLPGSGSHPSSAPSASDFRTHGRFTPGQIVADRYRIVSLLGRGGMGEVYRADDLRLGQSVALKFLPSSLTNDPERMARFHAEIRVARQVSHRNVCRMYDLGELAPPPGAPAGTRGDQFVSMEHVDGEDLSSLLRRIGRLPPDKAVDIARQLCAGLAAAHDAGVIHRDLKPANIMLDGRGSVRIMDFGVAALAADARAASEVAGTPPYMAPEQLAGREVSVRSDLYSLGLVLYEVFTGKRAFEHSKAARTMYELLAERQSAEISRPASVVLDMDPAVDRAIMRCLASEPVDRPGSAMAVLAALPGGDPLAAALAAGETPSPELVAASGGAGLLKPVIAWSLAASAVLLVALGAWLSAGKRVLAIVPLEAPPAVLEFEARKALNAAGITEAEADSASGWSVSGLRQRWIAETDLGPKKWDRLKEALPPSVAYWWRRSAVPLLPSQHGYLGAVTVTITDRPPLSQPGDALVVLTSSGKLSNLEIIRPRLAAASGRADRPAYEWSRLIELTGVQSSPLAEAKPEYFPEPPADRRFAWTGEHRSEQGDRQPFRIEAGSMGPDPTYFRVLWSNNAQYYYAPSHRPLAARAAAWIRDGLLLLLVVGSFVLARRNLRAGRGDRAAAARLAAAMVCLTFAGSALSAHELFNPTLNWFFAVLANALLLGAVSWGIYVGLEPFARRHWPTALVSWARLTSGRWRDPLVARDVLFGAAAGGVPGLVGLVLVLASSVGLPTGDPWSSAMDAEILATPRAAFAQLFGGGSQALIGAFASVLLLAFTQMALKSRRTALATAALMFMSLELGNESFTIAAAIIAAGNAALSLIVLARFGALALIITNFVASLRFPTGLPDLGKWHAYAGIVPLVAIAALVACAAMVATRRPSLRDQAGA